MFSKNKTIKMKGSISDSREMMSVKDLVKILFLIMRSNIKSGIYNVGTRKQIKILDVINYLNNKEKNKKKIVFTNEFKFPNFAKLDLKKINKVLKPILGLIFLKI